LGGGEREREKEREEIRKVPIARLEQDKQDKNKCIPTASTAPMRLFSIFWVASVRRTNSTAADLR
jgi:hypothetical protein